MGIVEKIDEDLNKAIRAPSRNIREVEILRLLKSTLFNAKIEKRGKEGRDATLNDDEAKTVVQKVIKSLEESMGLYREGGRDDLARQTEEELGLMRQYVPKQMGEEEVREVVQKVIAAMGEPTMTDFGLAMKEVMKELQGKADGGVVSKVVKELLG